MASDSREMAAKAGELREALAQQTEKSGRLIQRAGFMTEALPDVKRKAEQANRSISRIKQTREFSGGANFSPEAPQISEAEKESRFFSNKVLPRMNNSRKKGNTLF